MRNQEWPELDIPERPGIEAALAAARAAVRRAESAVARLADAVAEAGGN
jgi:hypothetical protein